MRLVRWTVFVLVAALFIILAVRPDVYELTSPAALSWHVLLRKAYSIVAFAIVGAAFAWASGTRVAFTALFTALYSGGIEAGQRITNGHESLAFEAFDVACGGVGGWLGAAILARLAK